MLTTSTWQCCWSNTTRWEAAQCPHSQTTFWWTSDGSPHACGCLTCELNIRPVPRRLNSVLQLGFAHFPSPVIRMLVRCMARNKRLFAMVLRTENSEYVFPASNHVALQLIPEERWHVPACRASRSHRVPLGT